MTEQSKTLEILKLAIQMETDGKAFYQKASHESQNEMGKKLLSTLAAEEDIHLKKFQEIYENLRQKKAWPAIDFQPDRGKTIHTLFALATREGVKATNSEIDAVNTAIEMEVKSYNLYIGQAKEATFQAEKSYFEMLAGEERGHHLALIDYQEYLRDPAGYFVKTEHPSLDGG